MSHFSNNITTDMTLTPASYRNAMQEIRAMRKTTMPVIDVLVYADHGWCFDFARLQKEDPTLAQYILQLQAENNGDIVIPPEIEEGLVQRGYMFKRDDA